MTDKDILIPKSIASLIAEGGDVMDLLPQEMAQVTREDAEYHASVRDKWIDLNQIETLRNRIFHEDALEQVTCGLDPGGSILELGCGVGYDGKQLVTSGRPFGCYVMSEIDRRLLEFAKREIDPVSSGRTIRFCCLDANRIMIADRQFDRVFAIAAAHHFPDLSKALGEIDRVTKPGGRIVFAIEPNRLWSSVLTGLRPIYRSIFPKSAHSAADEEAEGFRPAEFRRIAAMHGWQVERILPVWFLTGFLHLGLEAAYRTLRAPKRMKVPGFAERILLSADGVLMRIPGLRHLAWHYTVTFRKPG